MGTRICRELKSPLRAVALVAINIVTAVELAAAAEPARPQVSASDLVAHRSVETVYFTDGQHTPVKVVRGASSTGAVQVRREILTFGSGSGQQVAVFRGIVEPVSTPDGPSGGEDARPKSGMFRGGATSREAFSADLFSFAGKEEFDRIAEAVHGVESRYGTDFRMWRLDDLNGPQGPMQVSAAAAFDVGGGDRFNVHENMLLGRAYLARLLRRYGSWSDALAAYNWGPGNVDQWITRGRRAVQLPAETARYIERVLQLAFMGSMAGKTQR
jgi:hypothetical protein